MSLEKSAYIASVISKVGIPDTNSIHAKFVQLLSKMLKVEGDSATVASLNALTSPMPGLLITITTGGTLTLGGLSVVTNDVVYFNGSIWVKALWVQNIDPASNLTDNVSLVKGDSGKIYIVGADAKTATLPSSATVGAGVMYGFINGGADGSYGFTISPNAADKIMGIFGNIRMSGTDDKDLVNTKASARRGDWMVVVSDGVDGWYIYGGDGIWTEESQIAKNVIVTDNLTLKALDSGGTFAIATDAKTFTLPLITAAMVAEGTNYTFINTGADGTVALTISPNASDGINGTIANAAADSVASGALNKDLVNTKVTANKGDYVKIRAIALTAWYIVGGVGIWASEA